eukprot:2363830-Pyramimonas_sp.AAC.1
MRWAPRAGWGEGRARPDGAGRRGFARRRRSWLAPPRSAKGAARAFFGGFQGCRCRFSSSLSSPF